MSEPTNEELLAYRLKVDRAFQPAIESCQPTCCEEQAVMVTAFADMLGAMIGAITGTGSTIADRDPTLTDQKKREQNVAAGRAEVTRAAMKRVLEAAERAEGMAIEAIKAAQLQIKVSKRGQR